MMAPAAHGLYADGLASEQIGPGGVRGIPMNREEAERALGIIRKVIQNTREDLVAHNWGPIWMIHAFCNLAACLAGGYVESQGLGLFWYLVPLGLNAAVNILIVALLLKRYQ